MQCFDDNIDDVWFLTFTALGMFIGVKPLKNAHAAYLATLCKTRKSSTRHV